MLTHFIVSDDVERSRRFYTEVLGGRVAFPGNPVNVALANSWIVINSGGGPTDDKPTVTLETPRDPDRVNSFLNIRVKDIEAAYAAWSARGAHFLTPPKQHRYEKRCYIRDPDGHLIEVGQTTDPTGTGRPVTGRRVRVPKSPGECRTFAAVDPPGLSLVAAIQARTFPGGEGSGQNVTMIATGVIPLFHRRAMTARITGPAPDHASYGSGEGTPAPGPG